jgi:CspA family cold shock protein
MPNGTIKFFNAAKKFGFVTPDEGDKDVFVPVASVVAAGIATLTAGQRVSFETVPDGKGPKAINLVLIETPPPPSAVRIPAPIVREQKEQRRAQFTFYYDPSWDRARQVLAELRDAGVEMREIDYVATPLGREELKRLSMILQDGSGSLVRRYDPLFHDLRLDDRFISQNEFWDGIVENPSLINGPIIASANSASICASENAVKQFLAMAFPGRAYVAPEKKAAAEIAALPAPEDDEGDELETTAVESEPAGKAAKKTKAAPKPKAKAKAEPVAKKTVKKAVRKSAK